MCNCTRAARADQAGHDAEIGLVEIEQCGGDIEGRQAIARIGLPHVVRPISTGRTTARQATRRCRTADPAIRFDRISTKQRCPKPFNLNSFQ
jgi:hypothetical protein